MRSQAIGDRVVIALAVILPVTLYVILRLVPETDPMWNLPFFHFYIVSFTSLVALVSASYIFLDVGTRGVEPIFLTLAFAMMASVFFIHGFSTPGVLIPGFNAAVGWSARLSLQVGAVFIALALREYSLDWQTRIIRNRGSIWMLSVIGFVVYVGLIFRVPEPFMELDQYPLTPTIQTVITTILLGWATFKTWLRYRTQPTRLYRILMIALPWLFLAQISQHEAPLWAFSWWIYHIMMLGAFTLTMITLLATYEHKKDFRLTRYFVSLAITLGVPLTFILAEVTTRLTQREDLRWTLFVFFGTALILLLVALFGIVFRAQRILNDRAIAIEREKQWRADLTSLVAHDLKTPLNSILLNMDLIKQDLEANGAMSATLSRLDRSSDSAQTMAQLIYDMLDIERIEAGKLPLDKQSFDISTLIAASIANIQSVADFRDIRIESMVSDDLPMVHADEGIIQRIVQNLLGNALKFTPQGGDVTVEAVQEEQTIKIMVTDTGPGVPEDQRERIFEKFGQVRHIQRRAGYGLGLAFCKMAVEQHGGKIYMENILDGGSRFVFTLPVARVQIQSQIA